LWKFLRRGKMTKDAKIVFNGWLKLSESEKKEIEETIFNYKKLDYWEKDSMQKSMQRFCESISLGPHASNTCPCCGR